MWETGCRKGKRAKVGKGDGRGEHRVGSGKREVAEEQGRALIWLKSQV